MIINAKTLTAFLKKREELFQNWKRVHFKNKRNYIKYALTMNQINRH